MKLQELYEGKELKVSDLKIGSATQRKTWETRGFWPGSFNCSLKGLTSLEGSPTDVRDSFNCGNNSIKTLEHAPTLIGGDFYCYDCSLTNLVGAPKTVYGDFYCRLNKLTNLKGIHKLIDEIGENFVADANPFKSHMLGLLKIRKLKKVILDNKQVERILNKYLPEGDLLACQQELIDAGFEDFAQL